MTQVALPGPRSPSLGAEVATPGQMKQQGLLVSASTSRKAQGKLPKLESLGADPQLPWTPPDYLQHPNPLSCSINSHSLYKETEIKTVLQAG